MPRLSRRKQKAQSVKYSVYVHHFADDGGDAGNYWEKKETTIHLEQALTQAKTLNESGKYKKVEIKKKFFDSDDECTGDVLLKTYDGGHQSFLESMRIFVKPVLVCVLAFALIAMVVVSQLN